MKYAAKKGDARRKYMAEKCGPKMPKNAAENAAENGGARCGGTRHARPERAGPDAEKTARGSQPMKIDKKDERGIKEDEEG